MSLELLTSFAAVAGGHEKRQLWPPSRVLAALEARRRKLRASFSGKKAMLPAWPRTIVSYGSAEVLADEAKELAQAIRNQFDDGPRDGSSDRRTPQGNSSGHSTAAVENLSERGAPERRVQVVVVPDGVHDAMLFDSLELKPGASAAALDTVAQWICSMFGDQNSAKRTLDFGRTDL